MKKFAVMIFATFLTTTGCGSNRSVETSLTQITLEEVNKKVAALVSLTGGLQSLVDSGYASCSGPDVTDALVIKICQIAQAATVEMQAQLLAQLGVFQQALQSQIDQIKLDLISVGSDIGIINNNINAINTVLYGPNGNDGLIQKANDAYNMADAIQTYLTVIQTGATITGDMQPVFIGKENMLAGPVYEVLLQLREKTRVNGYVEDYATPVAADNNGFASTNGSSIITVASTGHGLSDGDLVEFSGVVFPVGTANFTPSDFNSVLYAITLVDVDHFTITAPRNANASNTGFGGNTITATKLNGRGMSTIWTTGDPSDTDVRITSAGSAPYNFIIRTLISDPTKCEICYDKTSASAGFVTINAAPEGGSGNIVCK
ncbi:MAG: hypothetical protein V1647_01255 [Pseudomonadota bacterium]